MSGSTRAQVLRLDPALGEAARRICVGSAGLRADPRARGVLPGNPMTAAPVPTLGTTFDCLEWDHQRLDALLADARAGIARGEPRAITFRAFRQGLERHCRIEEELLFPAFERDGGSRGAGATAVLRFEHELLRARVAEMDEALARGDLAGFEAAGEKLDTILAAHNVKEERVLYPGVDRALSDRERQALVTALRSG